MAQEKNQKVKPDEPGNDIALNDTESAKTSGQNGETGGPRGLEPTRYGDWERKGRCIDF